MNVKNAEIAEAVLKLSGKTAWGVRLGHGSFLTLEFGKPVVAQQGQSHGEWHLWLYMCNWRLETNQGVLAGSNDDRETIERALQETPFGAVEVIRAISRSSDLFIRFQSGVDLLSFSSSSSPDEEQWKLFTPQGKC